MEEYSTEVYKNHLIRGDLHVAVDYLGRFPEQAELLKRYKERLEEVGVNEIQQTVKFLFAGNERTLPWKKFL